MGGIYRCETEKKKKKEKNLEGWGRVRLLWHKEKTAKGHCWTELGTAGGWWCRNHSVEEIF